MNSNFFYARLLISVVMAFLSQQLCAASFFIDRAEIEQADSGAVIVIHFNLPVNIGALSPPDQGELLAIGVRTPNRVGAVEPGEIGRTDWLGSNVPGYREVYESITFERVGVSQGVVEIQFMRLTSYSVVNGADSRSIRISTNVKDSARSTRIEPTHDLPTAIETGSATGAGEKYVSLMEQARQAMAGQDYSRAVQIYNKILEDIAATRSEIEVTGNKPLPEDLAAYEKQALEYLGVARERKGQLAHANAIYQQYLVQYPEGEDAIRVQQRIVGLVSRSQVLPSTRRDREKTRDKQAGPQWSVFGGFSQYYRYADLTTEGEETNTFEDSLTTDMDLTARVRTETWELRSRASGGYRNDFREDAAADQERISDLYIEARNRKNGAAARVGRQNSSSGGVLGRFDGLLAGVQLSEKVRLNLVGGFPVESSTDTGINRDRYFYGVNMDLGLGDGAWEYNLFAIEQQVDEVLDRRAIGAELRYSRDNRSLFTLLDYDIEFEEMNTLLLIGNWLLAGGTNFSVTADYRKSPTLTLRNALSGQQIEVITMLLEVYGEDALREIAKDRTADSEFINFGITHPFTDTYQLTANVTRTNFGSLPASAGVPALEGTGDEYTYELSLIGSGVFRENDTNIFSLRYLDGNSSKRSTVSFDSRYPLGKSFRLNPRIRFDYQENIKSGLDTWIFRPSLRMDYRWRRRVHLELELGGEWSSRELGEAIDSEDSQGLFASVGYRLDF